MNTIALGLEYDGSLFSGFQSQRNELTIQNELEKALSQVADVPIRVTVAGRTDAKVHATQQVVSFDFYGERPLGAWIRGVNANMHPAIRVIWAEVTPVHFSARFSALWRRYIYVFLESDQRSALGRDFVKWQSRSLDEEAMREGAQCLIGEHDFSSFRGSQCQSRTPFRRIYALNVIRKGAMVYIDVTANAFLLHMVRNIAGTLASVGEQMIQSKEVMDILVACDRKVAPPTSGSEGLYLVHVGYNDIKLGSRARAPLILGSEMLD